MAFSDTKYKNIHLMLVEYQKVEAIQTKVKIGLLFIF